MNCVYDEPCGFAMKNMRLASPIFVESSGSPFADYLAYYLRLDSFSPLSSIKTGFEYDLGGFHIWNEQSHSYLYYSELRLFLHIMCRNWHTIHRNDQEKLHLLPST